MSTKYYELIPNNDLSVKKDDRDLVLMDKLLIGHNAKGWLFLLNREFVEEYRIALLADLKKYLEQPHIIIDEYDRPISADDMLAVFMSDIESGRAVPAYEKLSDATLPIADIQDG